MKVHMSVLTMSGWSCWSQWLAPEMMLRRKWFLMYRRQASAMSCSRKASRSPHSSNTGAFTSLWLSGRTLQNTNNTKIRAVSWFKISQIIAHSVCWKNLAGEILYYCCRRVKHWMIITFLVIYSLQLGFISCELSHSETLKTPDHELLACKRTQCHAVLGKLLLKVMHYNIVLLPKKVTNYVTQLLFMEGNPLR